MEPEPFQPFVLGQYDVLRELGTGASGRVYLAQERAAERRYVALKVVSPAVTTPAVEKALTQESRLAARLKHGNLRGTLAVERDGDTLMAAMEHVDGTDLGRFLGHLARQRRKLPPLLSVYVGWSVSRALGALHTVKDARGNVVGLLHRDVVPGNILVDQRGVVRLGDLGLVARAMATERMPAGKLAYAAPEVVKGGAGDVRSDVWSVGVVVWECLAGRRLFKGPDEAAVRAAVLAGTRVHPREHEPATTEQLDAAVMKALSPDPADRFATAAELEGALMEALSGHTARALAGALSKLVLQYVPVLKPEEMEKLPRPRAEPAPGEPDAVMASVDFTDRTELLPSLGTDSVKAWSQFNESFERPLTAPVDADGSAPKPPPPAAARPAREVSVKGPPPARETTGARAPPATPRPTSTPPPPAPTPPEPSPSPPVPAAARPSPPPRPPVGPARDAARPAESSARRAGADAPRKADTPASPPQEPPGTRVDAAPVRGPGLPPRGGTPALGTPAPAGPRAVAQRPAPTGTVVEPGPSPQELAAPPSPPPPTAPRAAARSAPPARTATAPAESFLSPSTVVEMRPALEDLLDPPAPPPPAAREPATRATPTGARVAPGAAPHAADKPAGKATDKAVEKPATRTVEKAPGKAAAAPTRAAPAVNASTVNASTVNASTVNASTPPSARVPPFTPRPRYGDDDDEEASPATVVTTNPLAPPARPVAPPETTGLDVDGLDVEGLDAGGMDPALPPAVDEVSQEVPLLVDDGDEDDILNGSTRDVRTEGLDVGAVLGEAMQATLEQAIPPDATDRGTLPPAARGGARVLDPAPPAVPKGPAVGLEEGLEFEDSSGSLDLQRHVGLVLNTQDEPQQVDTALLDAALMDHGLDLAPAPPTAAPPAAAAPAAVRGRPAARSMPRSSAPLDEDALDLDGMGGLEFGGAAPAPPRPPRGAVLPRGAPADDLLDFESASDPNLRPKDLLDPPVSAPPRAAVVVPPPPPAVVAPPAPAMTGGFMLSEAGEPARRTDPAQVLRRVMDPNVPRTFVVTLPSGLPRNSVEVGTFLALDHLALFPGLTDPPRHVGSTHTARMQMFLKTYQQQQLTGVWSLIGGGSYAALYMVQGNLHYMCMAGYHVPWLTGLVADARLDSGTAATLLEGALSGQRPIMDAVLDADITTAEAVVRTFQNWLLRRVAIMSAWGQCQYEYRPEVRLPFALPVLPLPMGSILEMSEAVDEND